MAEYHHLQPSSTAVKEQVMYALKEKSFRVIVIIGPGGVGKSTMMRSIVEDTREQRIFKAVVMATVSRSSNVRAIQDEISERLLIDLDPKAGVMVRANRLFKRLRDEKDVLVVLDNLSQVEELSNVGVPIGSRFNRRGCKLVVTTASDEVYRATEAQLVIRMGGLPEQEAWSLFRTVAGDVADNPKIRPVAEQIVGRCDGLPLAITTIASSLHMEYDSDAWSGFFLEMQRGAAAAGAMNQGYGHEIGPTIIRALQSVYNRLPTDAHRLFLLFCSLYPEDHDVSLDELMRYGVGEGFLGSGATGEEESDGDNTLKDTKMIMHAVVKKLKDSRLLADGNRKGHVRVHDIVRDVVLMITEANGEGAMLILAGRGILDEPEDYWHKSSSNEGYRRVSLMHNRIGSLPNRPNSGRLRTLLLQHNPNLQSIPVGFFDEMRSLVTLDLSNTDLASLPDSILQLRSLKMLNLDFCSKLTEQSVGLLGGLTGLVVLSVRGVKIKELPANIGHLSNLRILDLSFSKIEAIPPDVIGKLLSLEQLYMLGSFDKWVIDAEKARKNLASIKELTNLRWLNVLHVAVANAKLLSEAEVTLAELRKTLSSFVIWGGHASEAICFRCMQTLKLNTI